MTTNAARILQLRPAPVDPVGDAGRKRPAVAPNDDGATFSIDDGLALVIGRVYSKGGSEATVVSYRQHLKRFRDWCASRGVFTVKQITQDDIIDHWAYMRERGYSASTIRGAACVIRRLLLLCDKTNKVADVARVWRAVSEDMPKASKEMERPLTRAELERLLEAVAENRHARRDAALILFAVDSGLRLSELLALKVRDVNLETGEVYVQSGKGAKTRLDFVGVETRAALKTYLEHERRYAKPEAPLWQSQELKPMSKDALRKMLLKAAKRAGVPNLHTHLLRKTFCVNFLRAGGNVLEAQRLMGHEGPGLISKVYARLAEDDLARAHAAHGPVDALGLRAPTVKRDDE